MAQVESGILANILTSILGLFLRLATRIRARGYHGVSIHGKWLADIYFPDKQYNKVQMELEQVGETVTGKLHCLEGYSKGNRYTFSGTVKNLILSVTYEISDPSKIERGALVLMVQNDARELNGYLTYYENNKDRINSTKCRWDKI